MCKELFDRLSKINIEGKNNLCKTIKKLDSDIPILMLSDIKL